MVSFRSLRRNRRSDMLLGKKVTRAIGFHNGSLAAKRAEPSFRRIRGHSWMLLVALGCSSFTPNYFSIFYFSLPQKKGFPYFLFLCMYVVRLEFVTDVASQTTFKVVDVHLHEDFFVVAMNVKGALRWNGAEPIHVGLVQKRQAAGPIIVEPARTAIRTITDCQHMRHLFPFLISDLHSLTNLKVGHDLIALVVAVERNSLDLSIHALRMINQRLTRLIKEVVIVLIHDFATEGDSHGLLGHRCYSVSTFRYLLSNLCSPSIFYYGLCSKNRHLI